MACSMILIALFAKILPRKTVMTLALILASLLAILISVNENFTVILALRFAQGILLAGTSVGGLVGRMSLSFLTDVFD